MFKCCGRWLCYSILAVFLGAAQVSIAQNYGTCPTASNTQPNWTDINVSTFTGEYFLYDGGATQTTGKTLADYSYTFSLPTVTTSGCYLGASHCYARSSGGFGNDYYGTGVPHAVNVTTFNASCTPGIDCGTCKSSGVDCDGLQVPKAPAIGMRSQQFSSSKGFGFEGNFTGSVIFPPESGQGMVQTAFWHESQVYYGYSEYGFYKNANSNTIYFYWAMNSNCDDLCSDTPGNNGSSHLMYKNSPNAGQTASSYGVLYNQCELGSITPSNTYYYDAWIFKDTDNVFKFAVRVLDPNTFADVGACPCVIDPNKNTTPGQVLSSGTSAYYPIDWLTPDGGHTGKNGQGYVTIGVARSDPTNHQTLSSSSSSPTITAYRVYIAN